MAGVVLLEDILSISGVQIVSRVDTAILPPGDPEDQRRGRTSLRASDARQRRAGRT